MTTYFDTIDRNLALLDPADLDYDALRSLEMAMVRDVSVCTQMRDFPPDLVEPIATAILRYAVTDRETDTGANEAEDDTAAIRSVQRLSTTLHGLFHMVGERGLAAFGDDPRSPLRAVEGRASSYRSYLWRATHGCTDKPRTCSCGTRASFEPFTFGQMVDSTWFTCDGWAYLCTDHHCKNPPVLNELEQHHYERDIAFAVLGRPLTGEGIDYILRVLGLTRDQIPTTYVLPVGREVLDGDTPFMEHLTDRLLERPSP